MKIEMARRKNYNAATKATNDHSFSTASVCLLALPMTPSSCRASERRQNTLYSSAKLQKRICAKFAFIQINI